MDSTRLRQLSHHELVHLLADSGAECITARQVATRLKQLLPGFLARKQASYSHISRSKALRLALADKEYLSLVRQLTDQIETTGRLRVQWETCRMLIEARRSKNRTTFR